MGTGFTIDTPLRVAKYGISSAISLVDDILIEQMRKFHCARLGLDYQAIPQSDQNARAARITAYLNLLDEQVHNQLTALQSSPFEPGCEITRYFELLPDSPLKRSYIDMLALPDSTEKMRLQDELRRRVVPGSIDVNLMTKIDRDLYHDGVKLPQEFGDTMAALRGYANSSLRSSIIFSAGINPRLFGYLSKFDDFFPDEHGGLRKRIVLKVSDFRSAMIQGKYLARRGLWVSEYRVESGLNCGGHAFASEGHLMGPILEEFGSKKKEFVERLHEDYNRALTRMERVPVEQPHPVRLTVQGGIGTAEEQMFLLKKYGVDGTGWGTPFLLVPEVTNLDDSHREKLAGAAASDVYLSDQSPLGVPFWSLRSSAAEEIHRQRIASNKPGSPCQKGYAATNFEFASIPICSASRVYQKQKLAQLEDSTMSRKDIDFSRDRVLVKSCICHDLAGSATLTNGIDPNAHPAVCCGPNIVNFSKVATLEEMVGHIYGRLSLLADSKRPHMFIREVSLYVDYLRGEVQKTSEELLDKTAERFVDFKHNLISGIEYYRNLAEQFSLEQREGFLRDLDKLFSEIEKVLPASAVMTSPGMVS